ncbi:MAG: 3-hydroxybutyrate dehydrogenase [Micrococcales bacterium]|nr:3-hydroxybutyrate dehydrogenase [Micrococcales bacterium]
MSNDVTPAAVAAIDLAGRHALVTGAASGIGLAAAERLLAAGARVTAVDLDADGLERAFAGRPADRVAMDLCDLSTVERLPRDVDILVNNAGIQHVSPVEDFDPERFDLIIRLMLLSPFRLIRHALPHMYDRGWGRVVNISSVHGLRASAYKSAYVTAKHGLEGLSKTVALEGAARGVTSNCVNPGYVRTPLVEKQIASQAETHGISEDEVVEKVMLASMALKRLVEPAEVAEVVAFLCGPASASITGVSHVIDGGWTAH